MIDKILDRLPYDLLERVKLSHLYFASAGIGLLIFSVYFFTVFQVTQDELAQLRTKKTQTERKLKSYKNLIAQKDSIADRLILTKGRLDAMKQQLPRAKDLPGLLKEVASFGGGRGAFEVTRFQLEQGDVEDFYKTIPVAIQMHGSFWDTLDFLDKMQNRLQLVNVSDLKMFIKSNSQGRENRASAGANASRVNLHTQLVANTYAYIDGAEDKGTTAPAKASTVNNK